MKNVLDDIKHTIMYFDIKNQYTNDCVNELIYLIIIKNFTIIRKVIMVFHSIEHIDEIVKSLLI